MFSRNDPVIYIVIIYVVIVLDVLFLARTWRRGVGVAVVPEHPPTYTTMYLYRVGEELLVRGVSIFLGRRPPQSSRRSTQHGRSTPDIHSRPVWFYVQWYSMDAAGSMIDRADLVYCFRF